MEFLAVFDEQTLKDRLAHLSEESPSTAGMEEGEVSLRLLSTTPHRGATRSSMGLDVVTVQVRVMG